MTGFDSTKTITSKDTVATPIKKLLVSLILPTSTLCTRVPSSILSEKEGSAILL